MNHLMILKRIFENSECMDTQCIYRMAWASIQVLLTRQPNTDLKYLASMGLRKETHSSSSYFLVKTPCDIGCRTSLLACTQVVSSYRAGKELCAKCLRCAKHLRTRVFFTVSEPQTVYIQVWSLTSVVQNDRINESHNTPWLFPKEVLFLN